MRRSKGSTDPDHGRALGRVRLAHTVIWAVFAGAILLIPVAVATERPGLAAWLSALVWIEVAVLAANGMRCPLTGIAARHTEDRADNFDIILPLWLARHNKTLFGTLFAASQAYFLWDMVSRGA